MAFKQRSDLASERQIHVTEEDVTGSCRSEFTAGTHRRLPTHELGLAKRSLAFFTMSAVHGMALGVDRGDHAVPAIQIFGKFRQQIGVAVS